MDDHKYVANLEKELEKNRQWLQKILNESEKAMKRYGDRHGQEYNIERYDEASTYNDLAQQALSDQDTQILSASLDDRHEKFISQLQEGNEILRKSLETYQEAYFDAKQRYEKYKLSLEVASDKLLYMLHSNKPIDIMKSYLESTKRDIDESLR